MLYKKNSKKYHCGHISLSECVDICAVVCVGAAFSPWYNFPVQSSFLVWFTLAPASCYSVGWRVPKEVLNVSVLGLSRRKRGAWAWAGRCYLQISTLLIQRRYNPKLNMEEETFLVSSETFVSVSIWFSWACFGKRDVPVACDSRQRRGGGVRWGEAVSGIIRFILILLLPFFRLCTPVTQEPHGMSTSEAGACISHLECSAQLERAAVHSTEAPGVEVWSVASEQGVLLESWGKTVRNWYWSCSVNPRAPSCGGSCAGQSCSLGIGLGSWDCWDCPAPQFQSLCPLALLWGFKHVLAGKAALGNLFFF